MRPSSRSAQEFPTSESPLTASALRTLTLERAENAKEESVPSWGHNLRPPNTETPDRHTHLHHDSVEETPTCPYLIGAVTFLQIFSYWRCLKDVSPIHNQILFHWCKEEKCMSSNGCWAVRSWDPRLSLLGGPLLRTQPWKRKHWTRIACLKVSHGGIKSQTNPCLFLDIFFYVLFP